MTIERLTKYFIRRHQHLLHFRFELAHDGKHYQAPQPEAIKELADWQGVAYPSKWTEQAYQGLIKSLYDINNRSLVEVLTNTVDESNIFGTKSQIKQKVLSI